MVLVIDNYDSFTYNLVQYLGELGAELHVVRNDAVTVKDVDRLPVERIVISPGPGRPEQAGITVDLVRAYGSRVPILGVCLGHQAIGIAFGGAVVAAPALLHGKTSTVEHDGRGAVRRVDRAVPGGALSFARRGSDNRARRPGGGGDGARGRDHHGGPPSEMAGPWRAVSSGVGSDRRGPAHPG